MQPILKKKNLQEKEILEPTKKKKIKKPFIIECKWIRKWCWSKRDNEWHKHSSYQTEKSREQALKKLQHTKSSFYEVRIKSNNN